MEDKTIFLYKPAFFSEKKMKKHIDFYAAERREELLRAGVLALYEDYWNVRTVLRTNVYGALPQSALNEQQAACLLSFGWRMAEVGICCDEAQIDDERSASKDCGYMVLRENADGAERLKVLKFSYMPPAWQ